MKLWPVGFLFTVGTRPIHRIVGDGVPVSSPTTPLVISPCAVLKNVAYESVLIFSWVIKTLKTVFLFRSRLHPKKIAFIFTGSKTATATKPLSCDLYGTAVAASHWRCGVFVHRRLISRLLPNCCRPRIEESRHNFPPAKWRDRTGADAATRAGD